MPKHNFRVGAELEFYFNDDDDAEHAVYNLLNRNKYKLDTYDYASWQITSDESLHGYNGVELITPVFDYPVFKKEIKKVWKLLNRHVSTDWSTGYHHGISFKSDALTTKFKKRYGYFMWLWMHSEKKELQAWGRDENSYCETLSSLVEWSGHAAIIPGQPGLVNGNRLANAMLHLGYGSLASAADKFRSINFIHLNSNNPYIECRFPGGDNYHLKVSKALAAIERVMALMSKTVNVKYPKKFLKFLTDSGCDGNVLHTVIQNMEFKK